MADFMFKVIVVGQSGVGKTAIVQRYVQKEFQENEHATIGVDIGIKFLEIEGYRVQLKIWDSAGSERFKSLTTSYYRNADAAILVYCINDSKTLHELHSWANEVSNRQSGMLKILVGNKSDLEDERKLSPQTAVEFAQMENLDLAVECSAKCDDNVDFIFYTVARKLILKEIEKYNNNRNASKRERARTSDDVVQYQGAARSMDNLFISPRPSIHGRGDHHSKDTVDLATNRKDKSIFQKICTIL